METTVNEDRSGKGRLVYSWDTTQNVDHIDIDGTFSTIESNPTVQVTGNREYDSEGIHYKEITWTFEDIQKVDLEGLTYSFQKEGGKIIFMAMFEEVEMDKTQQPETVISPETPMDSTASALENEGISPVIPTAAAAGTEEEIPSAGNIGGSEGSPSGDQGLDPQTQMEMDAEMQRQMEEMFNVMIMSAVEGFSVKFQFLLPYEILDAPGAKIDGNTAVWEIPLKELLGTSMSEAGKYDKFIMVMNAEQE
jgi:hypothetical protein